jgi:hypothetical protein
MNKSPFLLKGRCSRFCAELKKGHLDKIRPKRYLDGRIKGHLDKGIQKTILGVDTEKKDIPTKLY